MPCGGVLSPVSLHGASVVQATCLIVSLCVEALKTGCVQPPPFSPSGIAFLQTEWGLRYQKYLWPLHAKVHVCNHTHTHTHTAVPIHMKAYTQVGSTCLCLLVLLVHTLTAVLRFFFKVLFWLFYLCGSACVCLCACIQMPTKLVIIQHYIMIINYY